jgi:hypothetical protein
LLFADHRTLFTNYFEYSATSRSFVCLVAQSALLQVLYPEGKEFGPWLAQKASADQSIFSRFGDPLPGLAPPRGGEPSSSSSLHAAGTLRWISLVSIPLIVL